MSHHIGNDRPFSDRDVQKTLDVSAGRRGLAIPVVLGTLIIVATLASAIAYQARSSYMLDVKHHWRTRDEWLLQAGLNRAVKALVTPGDSMKEALFNGRPAIFVIGGMGISLSMEGESEKVDIDFADPEVVRGRLNLVSPRIPSEIVDRITARLDGMRIRRMLISSPDMLLPLDRRFSPVSGVLRRFATTLSGQERPSPPREDQDTEVDVTAGAQSPSGLRIGNDGISSRPIYRLTATMTARDGRPPVAVPPSASIVIVLSVNDARAFKIAEGHL